MNTKKEMSIAVIFLAAAIVFVSSTPITNHVFAQSHDGQGDSGSKYEKFLNCLSDAAGPDSYPADDQIVKCYAESGYTQGGADSSNDKSADSSNDKSADSSNDKSADSSNDKSADSCADSGDANFVDSGDANSADNSADSCVDSSDADSADSNDDTSVDTSVVNSDDNNND
jgi:hypothetical protein